MLIRLPLPQCFCPRGRKLRPWSETNSDQNSDHPRHYINWGKEKRRPWSEFLGRGNSDHGLSFGCFWGRGRRGGYHRSLIERKVCIYIYAVGSISGTHFRFFWVNKWSTCRVNFERGEKTPTPKISALLRKRPVLLRANFVLTKDRKRSYYRHLCGKIYREGSCSKAGGGP